MGTIRVWPFVTSVLHCPVPPYVPFRSGSSSLPLDNIDVTVGPCLSWAVTSSGISSSDRLRGQKCNPLSRSQRRTVQPEGGRASRRGAQARLGFPLWCHCWDWAPSPVCCGAAGEGLAAAAARPGCPCSPAAAGEGGHSKGTAGRWAPSRTGSPSCCFSLLWSTPSDKTSYAGALWRQHLRREWWQKRVISCYYTTPWATCITVSWEYPLNRCVHRCVSWTKAKASENQSPFRKHLIFMQQSLSLCFPSVYWVKQYGLGSQQHRVGFGMEEQRGAARRSSAPGRKGSSPYAWIL